MASPSMSTPFPVYSPSRDLSNSHPYPIKTSSSAVLTRSNSSGHRSNSTSHHYTPASPPKNALPTKNSPYKYSHKHTKSLSSLNETLEAPSPVPTPPSPFVPARFANQMYESGFVSDGEGIPPTPPITWRLKRSETLPSVSSSKIDLQTGIEDLPKNPKIWSPTQLSVYLASSLRLKGGVKIPVPVARDISAFVLREHLSGRTFLRMKREDYDQLGINQLWKDALLDASRVLRQNLVQGRIMGFGSGSPLSPRSTEEMLEDDSIVPDLPALSSLEINRPRLPHQWEEDKNPMNKTTFRRGRVRGMVETYERSFSGSSASGSDYDEDDVVRKPANASKRDPDNGQLVYEPDEDDSGFASGEQTSPSEDELHGRQKFALKSPVNPGLDSTLTSPEVDLGGPFTPSSPRAITEEPATIVEDAPSIETLLREQENNGLEGKQYTSWGAKAWEDEVTDPMAAHVTARRVARATANKVLLPGSQETLGVATLPKAGGASRSLAGLFPQLEADIPSRTMQDASVGVEQEEGPGRTVDPAVYETLEALQKRLEVVESRLDEIERKDARRDEAEQRASSQAAEAELPATEQLEQTGTVANRPHVLDVLYPTNKREAEEQRQTKNYNEADPSFSGLPRYMFLISLGVVAVVTRVMLKRMVGGRRKA